MRRIQKSGYRGYTFWVEKVEAPLGIRELAICSADPVLKPWIERVGPCRIGLSKYEGSLFEALVSSIGSQQLSTKAADTILARLCQLTTESARYPAPNEVLRFDEDQLRAIGLSRPKARYILELAATIDQYPNLDQLAQMSDDAVVESLIPIKGIGRWSVEMLLMFTLDRENVLPVDDLGVMNGFKKVYGLPEKPSKAQMIDIAEAWKPYRSVGSWYMWQVLPLDV
jgi:DNA-3-methyladenine glycosylase II